MLVLFSKLKKKDYFDKWHGRAHSFWWKFSLPTNFLFLHFLPSPKKDTTHHNFIYRMNTWTHKIYIPTILTYFLILCFFFLLQQWKCWSSRDCPTQHQLVPRDSKWLTGEHAWISQPTNHEIIFPTFSLRKGSHTKPIFPCPKPSQIGYQTTAIRTTPIVQSVKIIKVSQS